VIEEGWIEDAALLGMIATVAGAPAVVVPVHLTPGINATSAERADITPTTAVKVAAAGTGPGMPSAAAGHNHLGTLWK